MRTNTTTRSVVGVFDDYAAAQRAVEELTSSGFNRDNIEVNSTQAASSQALGNTGLSGRSPGEMSGGGITGFFRRLFSSDVDERERGFYEEAVRRGSTVVCVTAEESRQEQAADILDRNGAIDIDSRMADWAQTHDQTHRGERSIPVVREDLHVDKREVTRGGVRVYNRVDEVPVEESVQLREEHVRVERRPANRPATERDLREVDEVIEVTERAEEPVVGKTTRVVEEVVVGKEVTDRTETIRDTVRRSDVNVERIGGDYSDDYRTHFKTRYGRNARYDDYAPAYDYGYRMASEDQYRGRDWSEVEPHLRSSYERQYPQSKWEQVKDAVRYGWDRVAGRR